MLPFAVLLFLIECLLLTLLVPPSLAQDIAKKVVYAVNCGGRAHRDSLGINYKQDELAFGIASDYGAHYRFENVPPQDAMLYQTERYNTADLTYKVSLPKGDGNYVLVLKFSEVYFRAAREKVFDVLMNDRVVISQLDIFASAGGTGWAHDRVLSFKVKDKTLILPNDLAVNDFDGTLILTFAKGAYDNPKVNAFYVAKDVDPNKIPLPQTRYEYMQAHPEDEQEEEEEIDGEENLQHYEQGQQGGEPPRADEQFASGPPVEDPYARRGGFLDSVGGFLPFIFGIALILVPTIYLLCKM